MRKTLVSMAMRLGAVCDLTSGQACLLHATAADSLPLRARAAHVRPRAKLGRDLNVQSITSAAHKASAASVSARATQTRAYSAQYGLDQEEAVDYEVKTIPWDHLAANAVSLIGNTGNDVEVKHLQTGRIVGNVRLACSHKAGETTWYDVIFWGPMAERIAAQVPKGSQICIQGKLTPSSWINRDGVKQTRFQITGSEVRFVEKYDPASAQQGRSGQPQTKESSPDEKWKSVFENPGLWWDNTTSKRNPRGPDFKLKADPTGMCALWIDSRDTPAWVKEQLEKSGVTSYQPSGYTDMN